MIQRLAHDAGGIRSRRRQRRRAQHRLQPLAGRVEGQGALPVGKLKKRHCCHTTFPGLRMPLGSKVCLMPCIKRHCVWPSDWRRKARLA